MKLDQEQINKIFYKIKIVLIENKEKNIFEVLAKIEDIQKEVRLFLEGRG